MAEAFDPDAYIKSKGLDKHQTEAFDPDAYIKSKGLDQTTKEPSFLGMTKSGLIRGGLNALPIAGSVAGGIIGGMAGGPAAPATAMGGAAIGGAAGEAYKQLGEKYMYGEGPKSSMESAKDIGTQGLLGGAGEGSGQLLGAGIKAVAPSVAKFGYKMGETLSGVPKKAIETFKGAPKEIESLYAANEGNMPQMADQVKKIANDAIFEKKSALNSQISNALESSKAQVDVVPTLDAINNVASKLDPKVATDAKQITQIKDLVDQITKASEASGEKMMMPIQTANRFKASFQDLASQSYAKPGEVYSLGTDAARAAKAGAANLREGIGTLEPAVADANATHAKLHDLEDMMHSNLLGVGKPEATLLAAGSGANQRAANVLGELSKITGKDISGEAEKLSAARYFGNPSYLPEGPQTGAMVARKGLAGTIGAGLGAGIGHLSGAPYGVLTGGAIGKYAGETLASPAMIAAGIKALNAGESVAPEVYQGIRQLSSRGLLEKYLNQAPGNK